MTHHKEGPVLQNLFKDHYDDLLALLNALKVGVYITDGEGNTVMVNDESCKTGGLTREDVHGRNMRDLEREGFVKESITLKVLASGKAETMIQELGDGNRIFSAALPVYKDGRIRHVVITEKDITESYILQKLLRQRQINETKYERELEYLRDSTIPTTGAVIARDQKMRRCVTQAKRAASFNTTVLLTGESGAGKEVLAHFIRNESDRKDKPFIKVNCAAIPENLLESEMFGYAEGAFTGAQKGGKVGYFELANEGTLLLDEIGDMPKNLQTKLLRVLSDNEVTPVGGTRPVRLDVRLIVATNKNLAAIIKEGNFREDLYYRLAIMQIEIPPLRERPLDIAPLAVQFVDAFSRKHAHKKTLEPGAIEALEQYDWPGNVRELQNVIERCMISFDGDSITSFQVAQLIRLDKDNPFPCDDPAGALENEGKTLNELLAEYKKQIILSALHRSRNASEASRKLGVNRSTLSRQMRRYGFVE
jgi:PAS domain S-box-containing protein